MSDKQALEEAVASRDAQVHARREEASRTADAFVASMTKRLQQWAPPIVDAAVTSQVEVTNRLKTGTRLTELKQAVKQFVDDLPRKVIEWFGRPDLWPHNKQAIGESELGDWAPAYTTTPGNKKIDKVLSDTAVKALHDKLREFGYVLYSALPVEWTVEQVGLYRAYAQALTAYAQALRAKGHAIQALERHEAASAWAKA